MDKRLPIHHRILSRDVNTIDYTKSVIGTDLLSITYKKGSMTIELTPDQLVDFKDKVALINQNLMLPSTAYSESNLTPLEDDHSFFITFDDISGNLILSQDARNAPYILVRTGYINQYPRIIQVYLSKQHIDKLDEITIRDIPFVYPPNIIQTADGSTPNTLIFTMSTGQYLVIEVPPASVGAFKLAMDNEAAYISNPATIQSINILTGMNVTPLTVDLDTITTITCNHTSPGNLSYVQLISEELIKLRRSVITVYLTKDVLLNLNTEVQLW